MKISTRFSRLLMRFRYPVALPVDVAEALGIEESCFLSLDTLLNCIKNGEYSPKNIQKYMLREDAEALFSQASCAEHFPRNTLFAFQFNKQWLEFSLQFDEDSRLRRLYLRHPSLPEENGIEIPLGGIPSVDLP